MAELLKYNVSDSIYFPLIDAGSVDCENTPISFVAADTQISKDGAAFANSTNLPTHIGGGIYKLVLTAAELSSKKVIVKLVDAATKAFEDQAILIDTYGNASGQHAFDLDQATQPVNVTELGGTVQSLTDLKDFADAGYDPATNKIEGVKLVDTTTTNSDMRGTNGVDTATMRGTDSAATAANLAIVDTVVDGIQTDLSNGVDGLGALKTLIDFVNTDLSNGTDGLGALKALIDTVNTDLSNGTDGLGALKTLIDLVNTDLSNPTDGLGALKTLIDALNNLSAANVNAEVLDVLNVDTFAEPAVGDPPNTATIIRMILELYHTLIHEIELNGTNKIFKTAAGADRMKKPISLVAGVYKEGESVTG